MKPFLRRLLGAALTIGSVSGAHSAVTVNIDPRYADTYRTFELGSAAGVPDNYGGLTFKLDDPGTLLVGGMANGPGAKIYSIAVQRDASGHITGFQGTATVFADAHGVTGGIDGGLAYGPGDVLFYTSFADNRIGQIEPGSTGPDKLVNLAPLGVTGSVGGLAFVPAGMPGAGRLKLVSILGNRWYDAIVTPDGTGTYNIARGPGGPITIRNSPDGIVYVPSGSPLFPVDSVLIAELRVGTIAAFEVNANGDPIASTRKPFVTDLLGFGGATLDPLTGDLLFSTFGTNPLGSNEIVRVSAVPEPGSWLLFALGLGILGAVLRRGPPTLNAGACVAWPAVRATRRSARAAATRSDTSPA